MESANVPACSRITWNCPLFSEYLNAVHGSFDVLDGILFPAICDVIRNLSGIWKMKFPDKLVRYLDVPQNFDRDIGGAFYRRELEELSQGLVRHGARELTDEALRDSIRKYNECSRLVRVVNLCEVGHAYPQEQG